ncbi:MAG TPA: hypothetical protein DCX47_11610, partial [Pseudomonas sp.]|nr:hypothetical protein [Pseudomonas sp.]
TSGLGIPAEPLFRSRAREKGLILLSCGTYYNVLRVLVPLTVEDELLERGLAILGECFDELT